MKYLLISYEDNMDVILKWHKELLRYFIVGIAMNGTGFLFYFLFTMFGVNPVLYISIAYPIRIIFTFYLNGRWSFRHEGRLSGSAVRYLFAYVCCYVLNVAVLKFFSGYLGYSHLLVQGITIFVVALILFVIQKHWVFKTWGICDANVPAL